MQTISLTAASPVPPELAPGVPQPRLVRAAHEFEAQMMKELLKPMTGDDPLTGESPDDGADTGSNSALQQFASEALGQALSRQGGFGMANQIVADLSHSGTHHGSGKVTGTLSVKSVIRAPQSLK
jgi:Rod binding domain-containing protein